MDTAHAKLLDQARRRGIQDPQRFKPAELAALLAALPPPEDAEPVVTPSSGAMPLDGLEVPHAPALQALAQDGAAPPPYTENPFYKEPPVNVPQRLGVDAIWLIAVDPETLFAVWDTSDVTRKKAAHGAKPVIRLMSPDALGHVDVEVDLRADGWYMAAGWERVRVVAWLGLMRDGQFEPLLSSRAVMVPPRTSAPVRPTFKAHIPYDLDRRLIPGDAVAAWSRGQPLPELPQIVVTPGQTPDDVAARMQQLEGAAREGFAPVYSGGDGAGRHTAPSPEVAETETLRFREMVLKGLRTWSWRLGGPNSSDLMMRGQEEWKRYLQAWVAERRPGVRPPPSLSIPGLPSSASLPSSHAWSGSYGRRNGGG